MWLKWRMGRYKRNLRADWQDAQRLWRRAKSKDVALQQDWQSLQQQVQTALQANALAPMQQASQALEVFVHRHLLRYRWPASVEYIVSFGSAILIALLLRSFVMEPFRIPSGSMIPTLAIGDQIFVNKFIYGLRLPWTTWRIIGTPNIARGEVFVFIAPPKPKDDYIKRVIGVAGDTVAVRRGQIVLNGQPLSQQYKGRQMVTEKQHGDWIPLEVDVFEEELDGHHYLILRDPRMFPRDMAEITIPPDHVFVMGDNRDHSSDSREWGLVPAGNAVGRAICVFWSWGEHGLEWRRLGQWID